MRGPKGCCRGDGGRGSFDVGAAMPALAGEAAVADDMRLDWRYLDLVVFADQLPIGVRRKGPATKLAMGWHMVAKGVGIVRKPPIMRLMPRLGTARTRILALFFLVRRRWL